jgi:hypothetical protein
MKRADGLIRLLLAAVSLTCGFSRPVSAQILTLMPLENQAWAPGPLRDACFNMSLWPTVATKTAFLGDAAWAVDRLSDADQQTCFSNMNAAGIGLALEVGVLKTLGAPCDTGAGCFWHQHPSWQRMKANGAQIGAFFLDEPLTAVDKGWAPGDFNYAVNETRAFIGLLRQNYSNAKVLSIEAYPWLDASEINGWITAMGSGPNKPDYFEIDIDFNASGWNGIDLASFRDNTRSWGMGFSLLYSYTSSNDGGDWPFYNGTDTECTILQNYGIDGDSYHVSAFNNSPQNTVPESYEQGFMGTVLHLLSRTCIAGTDH